MNSIFGDEISARTPENQYTDLAIRCRIINKMNKLGLPDSVVVPPPGASVTFDICNNAGQAAERRTMDHLPQRTDFVRNLLIKPH